MNADQPFTTLIILTSIIPLTGVNGAQDKVDQLADLAAQGSAHLDA
jgi:hypothetical protein